MGSRPVQLLLHSDPIVYRSRVDAQICFLAGTRTHGVCDDFCQNSVVAIIAGAFFVAFITKLCALV